MKQWAGFVVIMVLAVGAFTSIPNVSALTQNEYGDIILYKSSGTSQQKYGSNSGVCGLELCGSKSIPTLTVEEKAVIASQNPTNRALEKALQGNAASAILSDYYAYKQIQIPIISNQIIDEKNNTEFSNFANHDFITPKQLQSTVMKQQDDKTIIDKKKEQETLLKTKFPSYMRTTYQNPDHPKYTPKIEPIIKNVTNVSISNITNTDIIPVDLILFNLGFDVDISKIGICGPGTELVHGMCLISDKIDSVNTDWADYWSTKEDKEIVLEQVVMTNGTQALQINEDQILPINATTDNPTIEEPVNEEQTKETVVLETMTTIPDTSVIVDGKKFKNQESADKFLALKNKFTVKENAPLIQDNSNSTNSNNTNDEAPPFKTG